MPSAAYKVIRAAMLEQKQVLCTYDGRPRELCPIVLGHSDKKEKLLAYQVGGSSSKDLAPGAQWKCLFVERMQGARMRDGPWHEGDRHSQVQRCVHDVDVDINIHVRKRR
jgi:hypothetical protein